MEAVIVLDQWFSTSNFAPCIPISPGIFSNVWSHLCLSQLEGGGAVGIYWVEARHVADIYNDQGNILLQGVI